MSDTHEAPDDAHVSMRHKLRHPTVEMTSVIRRVAQLEPRTQYFYGSDVSGYVLNLAAGIDISPVMEMTSFSTAFPTSIQLAGPLLKDLGRQITVYNNTTPGVVGSPHIAVFRQVMDVKGRNTEGVTSPQPTPPTIAYICTWADISFPTRDLPFVIADVARTG